MASWTKFRRSSPPPGLYLFGVLQSFYAPNQLIHRCPVVGDGAAVLVPDYAHPVDDEISAQLAQVAAAKLVHTALGQELDVGQDGLGAENLAEIAALKAVSPVTVHFRVRKQGEGQL